MNTNDPVAPPPFPGPEYAPPPPPGTPPPAPVSTDERNLAMLCHLLGFCGLALPLGNVVGPLILWLIQKEKSPYVDWHGKESLNFQISFTLYGFVAGLSVFILVGFLLFPAVLLAWLILLVIGSVRASGGRTWRYPLTIPFLK